MVQEMALAGFVIHPIPEIGNLRLLDLLDRYSSTLDSYSTRLIWRPIDNPRKTGPMYEGMRTEEREELDLRAAIEFDNEVARRQSSDHFRRLEVDKLAQMLQIKESDRPVLVFVASPKSSDHLRLKIPAALLNSTETQDILAKHLITNITDESIERVLEHDVLTETSILRYQDHLNCVERDLFSLAEKYEFGGPALLVSSIRLQYILHGPTGVQPISADTRKQITARSREYQLLIDESSRTVWGRKKARSIPLQLSPLECTIISEVIASDRRIAPGSVTIPRPSRGPSL